MNERSVPELLSDLVSELTTLVRRESELFRAEIDEKIDQGKAAAGKVVGGAVLLLAALLVLLQAVVIGLTNAGMGAGWAALLVGLAVTAVAIGLLRSAGKEPGGISLDRTGRQIKKDARLAKDSMK